MMHCLSLELLGFAAGATNLCSSVPQLAANLRTPALAKGQSTARNCLQCGGNMLWLAYGGLAGSLAMTTFAGLGAAMALGLVFQTLRAKGHLDFGTQKAWGQLPFSLASPRAAPP